MQQSFTQEDLTRYIYRETNASETIAINEALQNNSTLAAQYRTLQSAQQQLPKVGFCPSKQSVNNILRYSQHKTLV